ncbi:histidine kinase/DNA gyrase B/HSP90-like ATPase [Pontibacter ummariensis]|uniref:histidine kinase n=1 Tax=Pontibacter ummariensis TaxID=1610492 RepID=A0A239D9J4_9BACT|nr:ATP-binding protein [Pontibacter ummariensis]PRY14290.1 histidine kinase/DNA gyrase B/HSP90-like ATPase [Pontibacter ummariensis]SNS28323.1 Histidine kinase-, DNA gyrase B-, and HSP90-like ATPase [Pontibacter ummariensis]
MVFNGFRLNLLLRLLLLVVGIFVFLLVIYRTDWYIAAFCLLLLVLAQVYGLIHFVERTNRDITSFLEAIRHSDFTQRFATEGANSSYHALYQSFNAVSDAFREIKAEKEVHYRYLLAIVEQVGVGLLSFDEKGEVQLINQVAKELLHVPYLGHIQALENRSPDLLRALRDTGHGEKSLVALQAGQEQQFLTLHATELAMQGKKVRIVTLVNIQQELEEQELQTWQKVIRVLTHEIMNSITPVISLTSTVANLLEQEVILKQAAGAPIDEETLEDMQAGLQTIEKRSAGMLHFVQNYRRLMRLPGSELRPVKVRDLLRNVHTLLQAEAEALRVALRVYLPEGEMEVLADAEQLEQVLINLVKNGVEACQGVAQPRVEVTAHAAEQEKGKVRIDVRDNGPGIEEEVQDKMFIPFYTNKKQGSGIGLSLSKQIMRQHEGNIWVNTQPGGPTVFSLQLKAAPND